MLHYRFLKKSVLFPSRGLGHGAGPGSGVGHGAGHGVGPGPHLAVRGDVKVICGGLSGIECHKCKPNVTMGLLTVEDHRLVGSIWCNPQLKPCTTSLV